MGGVIFYGDPHGVWRPLHDAVARHRPDGVVILGDMDAWRPLSAELEPLLEAGIRVRFIHGNHDKDSPEWWRNTVGDMPHAWLHGRVEQVGGILVAGMGGIFKQRIWLPRKSPTAPVFATRRDCLRSQAWGIRRPVEIRLELADAIFPEDFARLEGFHADVLVAHETASCHPYGFEAVDDLARDLRVRLVVTGHHHREFIGMTRDGIPVRGLAKAQPWLLVPGSLEGGVQ